LSCEVEVGLQFASPSGERSEPEGDAATDTTAHATIDHNGGG